MSGIFRQLAVVFAVCICMHGVNVADDTTAPLAESAADAPPQGAAEADAPQPENANEPDSSPAADEPAEDPEESSAEDEAFLQDPFTYLQNDMQSATLDLKDGVTTPPATITQPRILNRLSLLIEQLERQGAGAGQAGMQVNRPAEQSSLMRGPGGQNEMRAARDDGRDWANLTPQERQKILQSKTDGFPAGYDDILADYFRRLARANQSDVETTVPGETPAATDTTSSEN